MSLPQARDSYRAVTLHHTTQRSKGIGIAIFQSLIHLPSTGCPSHETQHHTYQQPTSIIIIRNSGESGMSALAASSSGLPFSSSYSME
jgi:hypothetical protein